MRLQVEPDDSVDLDNLIGDAFDPNVNQAIKPEKLKEQKQHEIDRINRDGVWGVISEYKCPACGSWKTADSCWGFIGDDYKDSGYDLDVMEETLNKLTTVCGLSTNLLLQ